MSREIPLSRGYVALVDDDDYEAVIAAGPWFFRKGERSRVAHAWRNIPHPDGGLRSDGRRARRTTQALHQFLTGYSITDHINGDGLDNRRANLRPATKSQNEANVTLTRANRSGYKGVSWHARDKRWRVFIGADGRRRCIGSFTDPREGARAYDAAAREAFGEYARLNFPVDGERAA